MNRFPRRGRTMPHRNQSSRPGTADKIKEPGVVCEVLHAPQTKQKLKTKNVANRCCYVTPNIRDFSQHYTGMSPIYSKEENKEERTDLDQFYTLLKHQYGCEPGISTMTNLKELKKVPSGSRHKAHTKLQHANQISDNTSLFPTASDGSGWQKVEGTEEVDRILSGCEPNGEAGCSSQQIFISEVPRVKVIAEKFSKYKRGNLELRKLGEKVVCVEYDIFTQSHNDKVLKLVQKMRAFFSIKPFNNDNERQGIPSLPSNIKNEFEVLDEDLDKLTDTEIEFIDENIEENKSFLEDLRRILKRKQKITAQKNKTSLDLQSLYEMAKRDRPLQSDYSSVNLLSNAELQEVKDLILQRCTSSVHGFRRKKIKQNEEREDGLSPNIGVISESIMAELLTITKKH